MFKIAICDDEQEVCSQLYQMLSNCTDKKAEELKIETFESGTALYNLLVTGERFDLIFLDIEMEEMDGVSLGKGIREEFLDEVTQIVYISANQKYALELFQTRPLHFLIKPLDKNEICKVIKKARVLKGLQNLCFEFLLNRVLHRIPHKEILYFESLDKKISIYTQEQVYEFYGKLPKIQKQLANLGFIQIHKSYLVNHMHIREVHSDHVTLSSGNMFAISKTFKQTALAQILEFGKE